MTARWVETEELAAAWFRDHGWPYCHRAGRGKPGMDLLGMPGLVPEIKAEPVLRSAWLAQHNGGGVPLVVWRPPKFGAVSIAEWPVLFRLRDATTLLLDAGYGTEEET